VAGTNERHPEVDVFSYHGVMAVKLLVDAGIAVYRSRVLVVCDNLFAPFLRAGLESAGAGVELVENLEDATTRITPDAILIALNPRSEPVVGTTEAALISSRWPGAVVVQYWGDLDRNALADVGLPFWPLKAPDAGHMGVIPSAVGPEPVVRLQAGGLKVAEVLLRETPSSAGREGEYIDDV
jgi:hypothetical protein